MPNMSQTSQDIIKRLDRLSRTMTAILRHRIKEHKLVMNAEGYVNLDSLLNLPDIKQFNPTLEDVKYCVKNDNKNRFGFIEEARLIRANQGHSVKGIIDYEKMMKLITAEDAPKYPEVLHGTYFEAYKIIKEHGLQPMSREQIHFAQGINALSGIRKDCTVRIFIDLQQAINNGLKFYLSENGVILTSDVVLPKYFSKVTNKKGNIIN